MIYFIFGIIVAMILAFIVALVLYIVNNWRRWKIIGRQRKK